MLVLAIALSSAQPVLIKPEYVDTIRCYGKGGRVVELGISAKRLAMIHAAEDAETEQTEMCLAKGYESLAEAVQP